MTPGEEALREAARLEAALVYGRVCREHKQPASVTAAVAESVLADRDELEVARRRRALERTA